MRKALGNLLVSVARAVLVIIHLPTQSLPRRNPLNWPAWCLHLILLPSLFALSIADPAAWGGSTPTDEEQATRQAFQQAKWTRGPATYDVETVAELKLPEGYAAVSGADARRISEALRNPVGDQNFTLVFTDKWYIKFTFDDMGYVKEDEKGSLDANAIFESIREGTERANAERAKRGWPPLKLVGWQEPPHYDDQTHNLTWAIRAEANGVPVVNYDTRVLGRRGVMRVKLVTDPETLPTAVAEFNTFLAGYSFKKGNRYAEWVQGDKVAAVGLTALITGGAAAVAVKSGLLKSLWKVLAAAGVASLAFFRKIFKRSSSA